MTEGRATLHLPYAHPEPAPEQGAERAAVDQPAAADPASGGPAEAQREPERSGDAPSEPEGAAPEFTLQDEQAPPLWPDHEARKLSQHWERVQDALVDEPRNAVAEADSLVASVATRMTELFADERAKLESQWDGDGEVSAEDLHTALLRYRALFGRVLAS